MRANAAETFDESIAEHENEAVDDDALNSAQELRSDLPANLNDGTELTELRQIVKTFDSNEIGVLLNQVEKELHNRVG